MRIYAPPNVGPFVAGLPVAADRRRITAAAGQFPVVRLRNPIGTGKLIRPIMALIGGSNAAGTYHTLTWLAGAVDVAQTTERWIDRRLVDADVRGRLTTESALALDANPFYTFQREGANGERILDLIGWVVTADSAISVFNETAATQLDVTWVWAEETP